MSSALKIIVLALGLAAAGPAGCGGAAEPPPAPPAVEIPAALFTAAPPAGAAPLLAAKQGAQSGDRVTFEARIGGRRAPFVEGRAVFFVADPSLATCDEIPGDTCRYPWDYCCEPSDKLREHLATVRIVDGEGRPLETSVEGRHGLVPLATVHVTGVARVDDAGNFVVDAEAIHVGPARKSG